MAQVLGRLIIDKGSLIYLETFDKIFSSTGYTIVRFLEILNAGC